MTARLQQLRDGIRAHIAESPTIITPMRRPLVDNGFGGYMRSGTPEAQAKARIRLSHEARSVQANTVGPSGLDTSLSLYALTDYLAPLLEGDTFEALGFTWTVSPVNPFPPVGALYKTEAPLIKGSAVPVTIPCDFAAAAISDTAIDLTWTDSGAVNTYSIERKTGTAAFAVVATPAAGVLVFHDTGRTASTAYTYRMRAWNGAAWSAYTAEAAATTEAPA